jgi:hypothetical protein
MISRAPTWEDFAILCDFEDIVFTGSLVIGELERYNVYLGMENLVTRQKLRDEQEYITGLL